MESPNFQRQESIRVTGGRNMLIEIDNLEANELDSNQPKQQQQLMPTVMDTNNHRYSLNSSIANNNNQKHLKVTFATSPTIAITK